jgi:hypothetical protein
MAAVTDTVLYFLHCACITRGCYSRLALDGPRNIDLLDLDIEVPEDRRMQNLLAANGWHLNYGKWICGNHPARTEAP